MLSATLENVLNRGLPRSPRARQLCRQLQGRRVGVEITGFTRLLVESSGETLLVKRDATTPADAELVGGPLGLMALSSAAPEAVLQRGDVQIRGDAELAQQFRELALLLRPDFEEELSQIIGDVPAHELGRVTRAAVGWTQRAAATTVRNVAEYLAHERRDLVPRAECDQLLAGVDRLREDVDRLEARIDVLARTLKARRGA
jgi:ubiquinone biosynthesis accessory factor UbiJ